MNILKFKKELEILEDKKIFLALSGGQDSMVLLHILHLNDYKFTVIHIDHAQHDRSNIIASEIKLYIEGLGIECIIARLDCHKKASETIMRIKRYEAFKKVVSPGAYLLMGHHQDDQYETFWLNLARGSSLHNLQGIAKLRAEDKFFIYRPLLSYSRDDIGLLHKSLKIPLWEDISNKDTSIKRNNLRHNLLVDFKAVFGDIKTHTLNLQTKISSLQYWADIAIKEAMLQCCYGALLRHNIFNKHPDFTKSDIIVSWLRELKITVSSDLIQLLLYHSNLKKGYCLYKNYTIITSYNVTWIIKEIHDIDSCMADNIWEHPFGTFKSNIKLTKASDLKKTNLKKRAQELKIPAYLRKYWPIIETEMNWWTPDKKDILLEISSFGEIIIQYWKIKDL